MGIVDRIEGTITLAAALFGAFVFSLGVGSAAMGCLRLAGIGWYSIFAYPIVLAVSLFACLFSRLFFMRFAIPMVALLSDELGTDDSPYSFTPLQGLASFVLIISILLLLAFALIPERSLLGIAGAVGLLIYIFSSKSLTDCYEEQSPSKMG